MRQMSYLYYMDDSVKGIFNSYKLILEANGFVNDVNSLFIKKLPGSEIHFDITNCKCAFATQVVNENDITTFGIFCIFKSMPLRSEEDLNYLMQHTFFKIPQRISKSPE